MLWLAFGDPLQTAVELYAVGTEKCIGSSHTETLHAPSADKHNLCTHTHTSILALPLHVACPFLNHRRRQVLLVLNHHRFRRHRHYPCYMLAVLTSRLRHFDVIPGRCACTADANLIPALRRRLQPALPCFQTGCVAANIDSCCQGQVAYALLMIDCKVGSLVGCLVELLVGR